MRLEEYFDVLEPDIIRLKGHRIFLEHIIERWLNGYSPEHIAQELPTLELEEVYGTITYYLHNRQEMDTYLERGRLRAEAMMREADAHPDAVTLRIRALKEQRRLEKQREIRSTRMQINEPPRFLLDENLSPEIAAGLVRRDRAIDVLLVSGRGAPPKGTLDPDILAFCEAERRALVTNNRKSMPGHLADVAAEGRLPWGIFQVRDIAALGEIIEGLYLLWGASDASQHVDRVRWIPE